MGLDIDVKVINELMKSMRQNGMDYLNIKSDDICLTIESRSSTPVCQERYTVVEEKISEECPDIKGNQVKSPIVGTFYAAPAPDKPPFVKPGQTVKKGDILFIIESMKLMNEVPSEFDGVVKEILVKNGESVEYGQTIMIIE